MNLTASRDTNLTLQRYIYPFTQHIIETYYQEQDQDQDQGAKENDDTQRQQHQEQQQLQLQLQQLPPKRESLDNSDTEVEVEVEIENEEPDYYKNIVVSNTENSNENMYNLLMARCKSFIYTLFKADYQRSLLIDKTLLEKQTATSYSDWKNTCLKLDDLTNKNEWKETKESTLYDFKLIENLTTDMKLNRLSKNYSQLLYLIRINWVRNIGNIGNVNLYRHSHIGTKYLIDEYLKESRLSLETLLESDCDLEDDYLLGILQQTRRNIGRTALVLSGGGTFGLFHIGVLTTLFELDLLPRVISGSSAGAIVASILTTHHKEEIPDLLNHVVENEFNIFQDDKRKSESENLLIKISRFFKNGTWFNNQHLINTMIDFLGDLTFREAYNRTGKILNITVSPASLFEQPRLLNSLTAPNVLIWSAVCASCSLPGIFPSSPLYEKDLKTGEKKEWSGSSSVKFVDGSVDNDLPISRLSEMFNVDHIIACQVNVHVVPFLKLSVSCVGGEIEDEFSARLKQNLSKIYGFMSNEIIHLLEMGSEIGLAKNPLTKFRSVLSQQYSGDITILPDLNFLLRINELLSNPTRPFLLREITNGAKATWPKISIIENHCLQEFALDKAISYLKGRIIVSSSIKNPLQFADIPVGLIKANIISKERMVQNGVIINDNDTPTTIDALNQLGNEKITTTLNDTNSNSNSTSNSNLNDNYSNVLDDNLIESESAKSLSLLSDHIQGSGHHNHNKRNNNKNHNNSDDTTDANGDDVDVDIEDVRDIDDYNRETSTEEHFLNSSPTYPLFQRRSGLSLTHRRRQSDTGVNHNNNKRHNLKSLSLSAASPGSIFTNRYTNRYNPVLKKGNTGHLFFPGQATQDSPRTRNITSSSSSSSHTRKNQLPLLSPAESASISVSKAMDDYRIESAPMATTNEVTTLMPNVKFIDPLITSPSYNKRRYQNMPLHNHHHYVKKNGKYNLVKHSFENNNNNITNNNNNNNNNKSNSKLLKEKLNNQDPDNSRRNSADGRLDQTSGESNKNTVRHFQPELRRNNSEYSSTRRRSITSSVSPDDSSSS
ncbi:triacylglycerol lipase NDAI_0E04990 [Naumovozyma dairenensis CBS 421]|uniref:PNPLA domain-containing protein n=1 Tax=Naumovozyma dairenensis (strain ATCC 10597 / BCRC 20456 / CBS 421 / NBRC 0211 / NRRL Y-12639) TaxID=1071378 RepID=G0WAP3_NAUDC|nr:hypothetical protein NDAI_0E04990 [Naumovozyma dairenensis CBS 421]CCD25316.1 hypothetical protein NDAI_0E04990 [Naumovozyma dairenensis CBS 421]